MRKLAAACFVLLALGASARAGGPGTTGANFLKIPVGPRQTALGDQGAALAEDAFSLAYNPAALALLDYQQLGLMHNQWVDGVSQEYLAYANPKPAFGAFGAGVNILQVGDFQGYDASGGKADNISAQDLAVSAGYARHVWGAKGADGFGLAAGASLTGMRERLEKESASGYAGDAGLLARFIVKEELPMRVGLAVRHLGRAPSYGQSSPLPRTVALGASATTRRPWGDPLTMALEARHTADKGLAFSAGSEYWVNSQLALRGGYVTSDELGPGVRIGIGVKIKVVEFSYAVSLMGGYGLAHRVGLTARIGAPIEKTPGMSPEALKVEKALKNARALMARQRYLEALLELDRALAIDATSPEALELLLRVQKALKKLEAPGRAP